jgi:hypothetical protein
VSTSVGNVTLLSRISASVEEEDDSMSTYEDGNDERKNKSPGGNKRGDFRKIK